MTDELTRDDPAPPVPARSGPLQLLFLVLTLVALWILWSGHYTGFLLTLGAASCAGVALLSHRMGIVDSESVPLHLVGRSLTYVPWLAWQVVLANFEVMRRILLPRAGDQPETVRVEASQQSALGVVSYANSITLTPGTVTLAADDTTLTVHALTPASAEGLFDGEMDRRVTRFEGLEGEEP